MTIPKTEKPVLFSENKYKQIFCKKIKDKMSIFLLVDQEKNLHAFLTEDGKIQTLTIQGIPHNLNGVTFNQAQLVLNDAIFHLQGSTIVITPRARGGLDPISVIVGAVLAVGVVVATKEDNPTVVVKGDQGKNPIIIGGKGDNNITIIENHPTYLQQFMEVPKNHPTLTRSLLGIFLVGIIVTGCSRYYTRKARNLPDSNDHGNTLLHKAVQKKDYDSVKNLLNYHLPNFYRRLSSFFVSACNINATNRAGDTAMHIAIRNNDLHMVRILLDNNADVYIGNNANETAYDLALNVQNEAIKHLVTSGNSLRNG